MQRKVYFDVLWEVEYEPSVSNATNTVELSFEEHEIELAMKIVEKILWSVRSVNIEYRYE